MKIIRGIGALFAGMGAAVQWRRGHRWYSIALVLTSIPATWVGVRRFTGRRS